VIDSPTTSWRTIRLVSDLVLLLLFLYWLLKGNIKDRVFVWESVGIGAIFAGLIIGNLIGNPWVFLSGVLVGVICSIVTVSFGLAYLIRRIRNGSVNN
jgi:hypothetical protein